MIHSRFDKELCRIVGASHVRSGPADAEVYSYDASLAKQAPSLIVFPGDTEETAAVVRAACEAGVPYVPRGFGTNLSGGTIASEGGLVISLSRMNRILSIAPERRCAVVQPGVTNHDLQDALAPLGFFFAPDPASQKVATLGGNAAENSGGPRCVKYGVTGNHVLGMEVVLPGGEVFRVGGSALDPPGYDLRGVIIGSEGTLCIATEITVRILPEAEGIITLLAVYDRVEDAARTVTEIMDAGIVPTTLEMMDTPIMRAVEESTPCGYPLDAAAVLIIEVDGLAACLKAQAAMIKKICGDQGCRSVKEALDGAERDRLWAGRRGAIGAVARLAPNYLVTDCTVPRTKLPEALARVAMVAEKHGLRHGNVFHAGDGNLHPLLFFDSRDPGALEGVHQAAMEIMEGCVALGGTITGEHGVGLEKIEAMDMVFSRDDLKIQRDLRLAFDPRELLNPGKILPGGLDEESLHTGGIQEPGTTFDLDRVPESGEEACEMVRCAGLARSPLLPLGKGRRRDFGNLSQGALTPLRSTGMAGIMENDPSNQFVTVGAGVELESLQDLLAAQGQWVALRPPLPGGCTVGGLTALGLSGPERLRYGAPRDQVLGLRFVSGKGRLITTGGKVVKNVAGYDLCRLLVGSAGTIGFITEVTWRLHTLPETCCAVHAEGSLEKVSACALDLLRSKTDPVFVAALGVADSEGEGRKPPGARRWCILIGYEGFSDFVKEQEVRCLSVFSRHGLKEEGVQAYPVRPGPFTAEYRKLHDLDYVLRIHLPLDLVPGWIRSGMEGLEAEHLLLDLGCGRVFAGLSSLPPDAWERLCKRAHRMGGHLLIERAPRSFREAHDLFGPRRPEWDLTHRIKEALDPLNLFAPGRLPGRR